MLHQCAFMMLLLCTAAEKSLISEITDIRIASQCFQPGGMSLVTLYCGHQHVISIRRAFHGARAHAGGGDICMYEVGDCFTNQTQTYNWATKCAGKHSCVQLLKRALMPDCSNMDSLGYLQVEYSCRPGTVTTTTIAPPTTSPTMAIKPVKKGIVVDICQNKSLTAKEITVTSPNFPKAVLPSNKDCYCNMIGMDQNHVIIQLQEISLGTHGGLCHDWLAVTFPSNLANKVVACGSLKDSGKQVVTPKDKASLHFHTAKGQHPSTLRGFKVHIKVEKGADLKIRCQAVANTKSGSGKSVVLPLTDLKKLPDNNPKLGGHNSGTTGISCSNYGQVTLMLFPILWFLY